MVLKYLSKLTEKIDSCTAEEKVPDWCSKVCIALCCCVVLGGNND